MPLTSTSDPINLGPITVTFFVDEEQSGGSVTVSKCDVAAGAGVPVSHFHNAFEETIYGVEGVTTWTIDGEDVEVGQGDTVCIKRGAIHSFVAGDEDASFLAIASPGVFGPAYFQDIASVIEAAGDGPPDPAELGAVMLRHGLTPAPQPTA